MASSRAALTRAATAPRWATELMSDAWITLSVIGVALVMSASTVVPAAVVGGSPVNAIAGMFPTRTVGQAIMAASTTAASHRRPRLPPKRTLLHEALSPMRIDPRV
jgi:hypothetical protein